MTKPTAASKLPPCFLASSPAVLAAGSPLKPQGMGRALQKLDGAPPSASGHPSSSSRHRGVTGVCPSPSQRADGSCSFWCWALPQKHKDAAAPAGEPGSRKGSIGVSSRTNQTPNPRRSLLETIQFLEQYSNCVGEADYELTLVNSNYQLIDFTFILPMVVSCF